MSLLRVAAACVLALPSACGGDATESGDADVADVIATDTSTDDVVPDGSGDDVDDLPAFDPPPANPFLADSAWSVSHGSSYAQGSSALPGLDGEAFDVQTLDAFTSVTLVFEPDGTRFWGSSPFEVYRARIEDPLRITARVDAGGGLEDVFAGAYTLLDRDNRFFVAMQAELRVYEPDGPDGIRALEPFRIPEPADGERVRGLNMTYDGVVVAATSTGRVIAIDRTTLTTLGAVQLDGDVSNSIAIDEDGGIYVVTSEAMFRVQWTGDGLSTDPADGAWRATYDVGPDDPAGGRLGVGSGSTPSLMNAGDDKLVIITDGAELMHLVAFWRDEVPAGWIPPEGGDARTAAYVPVTFGDPAATTSTSEQSVLVMGDGAVVVSNDYGDAEGFEPVFQGIAPFGIEKFVWDPDLDALTTAWVVDDISCPNGIPTASAPTGLMYCWGKRGETWTLEAIDWEQGTPRFHVPLGDGIDFNSVYAATEVGPNGEIWSGVWGGAVRVRPRP